jgi:hypothetical protein
VQADTDIRASEGLLLQSVISTGARRHQGHALPYHHHPPVSLRHVRGFYPHRVQVFVNPSRRISVSRWSPETVRRCLSTYLDSVLQACSHQSTHVTHSTERVRMRFSRLIESRHPISLLHTLLPLGPVNSYKKLSDGQEHVRALLHASARVPPGCRHVNSRLSLSAETMGCHATVIPTNNPQYCLPSERP